MIAAGVPLCVVLLEVATYLLFADRAIEVAAIRRYVGGEGFGRYRFVYVAEWAWARMSVSQKTRVTRELSRHIPAVYHAPEDLPEVCRMPFPDEILARIKAASEEHSRLQSFAPETLEAERRLAERGYEVDWSLGGGLAIWWRVDRRGPFWMEVPLYRMSSRNSRVCVGEIHVWVLWRWFRVCTLYHHDKP